MNESTAQANGYRPVERPTDLFADEMLQTFVAREVTRQLAVPRKARWTVDDYLELARSLAWWAGLFVIGFILGGGAS